MSRVARWFLAPQPLHALVACRVIFGASLVGFYAPRLPAALDLFGPEGIGGAGFYGRVPLAPPLDPQLGRWLDGLRAIPSDALVWLLYVVLLASALAFVLGLATRLSGVLTLGLHLLFFARNPYAYGGWAGYLNGLLLYVVLAPVGRHLSLDAWLRRRRDPGGPPASWLGPGWPLRLLQIHVCTMYLVAGWSRFDKPVWLEGDLVLVALSGAAFSRLAIDWTPAAPLLSALTYTTQLLEALAPFVLWIPGAGRAWALALIGLHAGLELSTHIEYWSWVMIGGLLAFVLPWPSREPRRPDERGLD